MRKIMLVDFLSCGVLVILMNFDCGSIIIILDVLKVFFEDVIDDEGNRKYVWFIYDIW